MTRIITASALSLLMATAAFAQSTNTFDATQSSVFMNEQGKMRSSSEAKTRFQALPADQQAQIRSTCTQYKAASAGGSGSSSKTTTGSTSSTSKTTSSGSASTSGSGGSSGSASGGTMLSMADMGQACNMVDSF